MKTLVLLLLVASSAMAQILPEKDRATLKNELLIDRYENLLPDLMQRTGIDMWVLISREYNEDPVLKTMLPATWLNARRRTILVFFRDPVFNTVERFAISRYDVGEHIKSAWDKETEPNQWKALIALIETWKPKTIGINISEHFGIADGLVHTDYQALKKALPQEMEDKLVSAEALAIGWIESRTPKEMKLYTTLVRITHDIIDEAFSNAVITPGVTTTEDVVWWMRQKVTDMGLETWFHPTIDLQRFKEPLVSEEGGIEQENSEIKISENIIREGDLLHCDFGITYIGLNTDCQQLGYVLKDGEMKVPTFLDQALRKGNRLQDILTTNFKTGRTGNELLEISLTEAKAEGLQPTIYTHPLGMYGHSAGTTIGMWDAQEGVPFTGDYPMHPNTVYAIELNTIVALKEWNQDIRIMLEEAGFYGEEGFRYVNGRQESIKAIRF
ncbi:M24 family metallopeptidase [Cochleicola gelatinilyticus]|uniref:Xaa-Pro aminopeptidase n=1 Tax=Cochleicola gelatinilyticus TaxID=1763537 RepID=A0A167HHW1_9FLAO|nr:M24 family metallopeptidase [Cochleicola gelatinilyticus]OAB78621.1 Xaa-Pro aminopeptidase [Cochleicola gelatinilyticus]